jgi:lipopolysaccharide export system protein LptA
MEGNLQTRDVTFQGQVRCVQGPVSTWDQAVRVEGLTQLPEDTVVVNASTLRVGQRQMQTSAWHEIEADGNVEVEGGLGENGGFFARGARLTYDQRKDLLILDGGAGMAELFHERSPGTKPLEVKQRTIHVSPHRKYVHSSGFSQSSGGF